MKTLNTIVLTLACLALVSFTVSETNTAQANFEDVGIIKQSLLKPVQFNKTQEGTWILLNGQAIDRGSALYQLLDENFDLNILTKKGDTYYLPNASGAFIRSSNVNGVGLDPDQNRLVGSVQSSEVGPHQHKIDYPLEQSPWGTNVMPDGVWGHYPNRVNAGFSQGRGSKTNTKTLSTKETRPVNITMYTYIKIDN
ncbi:hypothetical protein [Winogradskyella ouciana]|uniref:hypothetical protein n=1 Tax=Winogradskyella ouciana TaxID=2608631 RepID=UPI003D2D0582